MCRFLLLFLFLLGCSSDLDSLENYWSKKIKGYTCRNFITFSLGLYTRGVWCLLEDLKTIGTEIEIGTYEVNNNLLYLTPSLGSCTGKYDEYFNRSTYIISYKLTNYGLFIFEGWDADKQSNKFTTYYSGGAPSFKNTYGCYSRETGNFQPNPLSTYKDL